MIRSKNFLACLLLLFFVNGFSQTKIPPPPPPVPMPEIKVEKPLPPEKAIMPELNLQPAPPKPPIPPPPPPPPPPDIKGHSWTRNGQNVYVVKPPKKV